MTTTSNISKAAAALGRKGGKVTSEAKATAVRANGSKSKWAFKVVKMQRGGQGQWFAYPAAETFVNETEANEYAKNFAEQQAGVGGTRITVQTRGGKVVGNYPVK